ncbi:mucin-3A-like [Myxocyprinus asiaticus]|uniref:mucin-3A-like n=1 Tax=Myxocyprinus asiaticus TaxID=70543 RepID=UPI002222AC81|nr:mucin-3A-like [Myxocyprinus asiaticus]
MMKFIPTASATLVVCWLLVFIGVNSVDISVMGFPNQSTDAMTPHPLTAVIMDLRITNRIYNDSLADQQAVEYITLRREVEELFYDIYEPTPLTYLGINEMTFSIGSVIASSRLLFGTAMLNPVLVRSIYLYAYKQIPSPTLEIDLGFVENELPAQEPFEEQGPTSRPPSTPHTEKPLLTTLSMATPLTSTPDIRTDTPSLASRDPTTHSPSMTNSFLLGSSADVGNTTHSLSSISQSPTSTHLNNTTMHPNMSNTSSFFAAPNENTTEAFNSTITAAQNGTTIAAPNDTTTAAFNGTMTAAPNGTTTAAFNSTTTEASNGTTITAPNSTTAESPNGTTTAPSSTLPSIHSTSDMNSTIRSTPFTTIQPPKTTVVSQSPTTATAWVPSWGIALLVLAAVSLFLLIILLIVVVVLRCKRPIRRGFVNEPDELNPPMYFNPDISMYSTHSTLDTANGKQVDVREKPPKNRTGMYVVNK